MNAMQAVKVRLLRASNWINGTPRFDGPLKESMSPSTGQVVGCYPDHGLGAAKAAVAAATRAFGRTVWSRDHELRARVLEQLAHAFERNHQRLLDVLMLERGKVKREATFELERVPRKLRYSAAAALLEEGRGRKLRPGQASMILRQPMGVAGVMASWRSPVMLTIRSLAPALAAGCTVVVRLPSQVAQTASVMARIMAESEDLPAGVINLFFESGQEGRTYLVDAPQVPVISFAGSARAARAVGCSAARHMKRIGMEAGGKTPMILFDDADLARALPALESALTISSGQSCIGGARLLVQDGIYDAVRDGMAERLRMMKVGPASDSGSELGPMIDHATMQYLQRMVEAAIAAGAHVVVRGGPVSHGPLAKGAFFLPTLLEVFDNSLDIIQQDIFGPVLTLQRFSDESEAIQLANGATCGPAASIWMGDVDRAARMAQAIQVGSVWINDCVRIFDGTEEGGFRQSGLGRCNGLTALEDFLEYKHVTLRPGSAER